jgi:predicted homoserine dehydrogenase-like protein
VTTWTRVARRAAEDRPLAVGVIGAGYVGRGLVHLLARLDGFRPAVVCNRTPERGVAAFTGAGFAPGDVTVTNDEAAVLDSVASQRPVVTTNPEVAVGVGDVDVWVEATGTLDHGATAMLALLGAGRTVVSINAEVDATLGWLLHAVAAANGGVYSICDGDQPGVQLRTIDRVSHMAFDIVASINCKRHLDRYQTVAGSAPYAARDNTSIAVTVSAGDGTKMNIEQAVVANLAGLVPECRGMHGVPTTLEHALTDVLGAISRDGVVDYTIGGDFGAGVFVIGRPGAGDVDAVRTPLRFFKLGEGPDYLVFSPHTLVHFEMPRSIAEVALDGAPLWSPAAPPVADVIAIAKCDLAAGERLDGIGGDTCYGQIDTVDGARGALPIAFAEHARVTRAVRRDDAITLDAVELDSEAPIVALRRRQDELLRMVV